MDFLAEGAAQALRLLAGGNREVWAAVWISVWVAFASTCVAAVVGLPVGYAVSVGRFRGRRAALVALNALLGVPSVGIGLLVYSFLSRRGPFGSWGMLFTPAAMVIGQAVLAAPVVAALTRAAFAGLDPRARQTAVSLGAGPVRVALTAARELGPALTAAVMAAFGRVFGEVGISLMLGGNILFYTRNITTSIALETAKGEFALGLALGGILLVISFAVSLAVHVMRGPEESR
ncbi:MAG: ABC transporter permease [Candidatus Coatesbacteria bacterium]